MTNRRGCEGRRDTIFSFSLSEKNRSFRSFWSHLQTSSPSPSSSPSSSPLELSFRAPVYQWTEEKKKRGKAVFYDELLSRLESRRRRRTDGREESEGRERFLPVTRRESKDPTPENPGSLCPMSLFPSSLLLHACVRLSLFHVACQSGFGRHQILTHSRSPHNQDALSKARKGE